MNDAEYPALYQAANMASLRGQKWYLRLVRADLLLVVIAAALGSIVAFVPHQAETGFAAATAIVLVGAMVSKFVNRQRRDDRDWFDGRAVAESVKTETWRYMMRLEPFDDNSTCDREFIRELEAFLNARSSLRQELRGLPSNAQQISQKMRKIRDLDLTNRRDLYIKQRLDEQVKWYKNKALQNQELADRWFWASLGAQLAALIDAIFRIAVAGMELNAVGLFAAIATASTAWAQVGRHDELGKSYALAYQELLMIEGLGDRVTTEDELSQLIRDGEGAISREHTMWIAKRGEPLPPIIQR